MSAFFVDFTQHIKAKKAAEESATLILINLKVYYFTTFIVSLILFPTTFTK